MQRTINNYPAMKVGNVKRGARVHIQVITTGVTVRFGSRGDILDNPTPFGGAQGMSFTSVDGVIELVWPDTEIWASGIAANAPTLPVIEISGGLIA
jgi:hypothetical protein